VANYEEEELPHDPSEETLTIEARFQPLLMETMTKSKDGFLGVSRGWVMAQGDHWWQGLCTLAPEDRPVLSWESRRELQKPLPYSGKLGEFSGRGDSWQAVPRMGAS
jgi:hypothetical protein